MKKRLSLVVALAMLLQVLMLVPVMAEDTAPALTELKYDSTSKSVSCKVSNLEASEIKGAYLVRFNNAGEWIENIYGSNGLTYTMMDSTLTAVYAKFKAGYRYALGVKYQKAEDTAAKQLKVSFNTDSATSFDASNDMEFWGNAANKGSYWKAYVREWGNWYHLFPGTMTQADQWNIYLGGTDASHKCGVQHIFVQESSTAASDYKTSWGAVTYPFISKEIMSAGTGNIGGNSAQYTVMKGFTAPYSGKVTITQNNILTKNEDEKGQIWASVRKEEGNGVGVKITRNASDVVWPETGNFLSLDSSNSGICDFAPLTIDVKKGDILYFEVKNLKSNTSDLKSSYAHWNPVVTYTDIVTDCSFTGSNGAAITKVSDVLKSNGAKMKISAFDASGIGGKKASPIAVFYDGDTLKSVAIGEQMDINTPGSVQSTEVSLGDLSESGATSMKVMLWDMTDGLMKPVSSIIEP